MGMRPRLAEATARGTRKAKHPRGKTGLQKARRVGMIGLPDTIIPGSAGHLGAAFGRPSAFQGSGFSALRESAEKFRPLGMLVC
jgi:hypothetical protein